MIYCTATLKGISEWNYAFLTPLFQSKTYLCYRIGTKHIAIENPLFGDVALTHPLKCGQRYTRNFLCKLRILLYVNNVRRVQRNKLLLSISTITLFKSVFSSIGTPTA